MKRTINKPLIDRVNARFIERFGGKPAGIVRAPGRINLLGEHVDYNDGFVMPAAIDRATYIAYSPSESHASTLLANDFEQECIFDEKTVQLKNQINGGLLPEWGFYPAGVADTLRKHGYGLQPINAVFASDIPMGSGLSSSAAVEVGFLTAWLTLAELTIPQIQRAKICQQAENEYVGVNCGIMDQFASICGVEDSLLQLDCRSLEWDSIPFPRDVYILIADTKVRRKLVSGEYNLRRRDCEEAVRLLKSKLPEIQSLRDVDVKTYQKYSGLLPERVEKRARHVVEEIARTMDARRYLSQGDITSFGRLMNECHLSLRDLYEVSCPELDTMVEIAQSLDDCLGSRLTGAGFGGCTVSLVEIEKVEAFKSRLAMEYTNKTQRIPEIYTTKPSNGAEIL